MKIKKIDNHKKELIYICLLISLLVVAIVYIVIGVNIIDVNKEKQTYLIISEVIMAIWFTLLPMTFEKKKKAVYQILIVLSEFILILFATIYWANCMGSLNWIMDSAIAITLIAIITHWIYLFYMVFIVIFKIMSRLIPSRDNEKLLNLISTFIMSITAFLTVIAGFLGIIM